MKGEQDTRNKIDEMKIIREVNIQAEALYEEAKELGNQAAAAFGEKHRAQITGLENIAETALKTSDIFDYVKRQTARHEQWRTSNFGKTLIEKLEKELANRRRSICSPLKINEKTEEGRRIYLLLIRQFIRQIAVQYEFQASFGKGARRNGTD